MASASASCGCRHAGRNKSGKSCNGFTAQRPKDTLLNAAYLTHIVPDWWLQQGATQQPSAHSDQTGWPGIPLSLYARHARA
eukprot:361935-Chlamydomonas_euryale.AAC.14